MATTEQLMAQYGVVWFGFDEASGNVYDKLGLGNYVGTPSNIQRLEGWNGEGYSASFNGTSSVISQNATMPDKEVTIRYKFRTSVKKTSGMYQLATVNTFATQKGMIAAIIDGKFALTWTSAGATYCFEHISTNDYSDGKWHDLFISWDGLTGSLVYIYIDDMVNPIAKIKAMSSNNGHSFPVFPIGRLANSTAGWYSGEMDDLQIYNKALSPSDFTQKRLAVKTTDNKNLALSAISARVKEIPNTTEDTLLSQGGVIKEIDSAVDRPLMDLTRATTEYEITNNINSALGSGKAFTVPIATNFKTIVIEDNY